MPVTRLTCLEEAIQVAGACKMWVHLRSEAADALAATCALELIFERLNSLNCSDNKI